MIFLVILRIYAVVLRQESERKGFEERIVCAVHAFQLVLLIQLTLSAQRSISKGCGSSDSLWQTSTVCAAGLGFSASRLCGCVGWPFFPLHRLSLRSCWSPNVVASRLGRPRLGLASRRPDLVVVLAGSPFHCTCSLLWLYLEPLFSLSVVELLRCLHVERQRFALSAALPDLPSAWTPPESRTLSLRRVSRRPVLSHQSRQRRCRPPLQLWAPLLARRLRCRNVHHTDALLNQLMGRSRTLWRVIGSGQRFSLQVLPSTSNDSFCSLWFFDCSSPPARGLGRDGAGLWSQLPPRAQVHPLSSFTVEVCATASRVSSPVLPRPRNSSGSACAPSRICAHKHHCPAAQDILYTSRLHKALLTWAWRSEGTPSELIAPSVVRMWV